METERIESLISVYANIIVAVIIRGESPAFSIVLLALAALFYYRYVKFSK